MQAAAVAAPAVRGGEGQPAAGAAANHGIGDGVAALLTSAQTAGVARWGCDPFGFVIESLVHFDWISRR